MQIIESIKNKFEKKTTLDKIINWFRRHNNSKQRRKPIDYWNIIKILWKFKGVTKRFIITWKHNSLKPHIVFTIN